MYFIAVAFKQTNEPLFFLYFMRCTMLLTSKTDLETMYKASENFRDVLSLCDGFFASKCQDTVDTVTMEGIVYYIDFLKYLLNFGQMHIYLKGLDFVSKLVQMLKVHTLPQVVSSVC
jgi:hypothetical protein